MSVDGQPSLHHSRFAAEDRARLDTCVEQVLGKGSAEAGVIVVGTQTLEQSLDISADLLITDLCPMDVLLRGAGGCTAMPGPRTRRGLIPRPASSSFLNRAWSR